MTTLTNTTTQPSSGGRLVAANGHTLPLRRTGLETTAGGGLARTVLTQTFANPYREPLAVTYQLPLPADGAVSAFAFTIGDLRITGEIDRRQEARERFEQAIATGHSAALLEEDRSSLFTQEIGNIPPGCEIVAELTVDQPLQWIDGGQWEWRFPTTVAPRYLGAPGRVPDADRVTVDVADAPLPPRLELSLSIDEPLVTGSEPSSPSHALCVAPGDDRFVVALAAEAGARLDRDVAVRWQVGTPEAGASLTTARAEDDSAYGLLTLVPPGTTSGAEPVARDVIVLLDTSGSMSGAPLKQARAIVSAVVATLAERDRLEMVEFSTRPRAWKRAPARMTAAARKDALRWLGALRAGGATEMHAAVLAALKPLHRESQRQVVLVTDGLIGFEEEIVREVLERLPAASRVHTVGVGSAPNRALTSAAARAGRGIEVLVGLDEDPAEAARRLVARTNAPLVVGLEVSGSAVRAQAPECLPDLFAGAPAKIALQLRPGGGQVVVRGRTADGSFEQNLTAVPQAEGAGRSEVIAWFGREQIEDLEMRRAAGGRAEKIDARIEALGLTFQLASRMTSWVAVSEQETVDPREPLRRERVPHELPHGMSVQGLGLRPAAPGMAYGAGFADGEAMMDFMMEETRAAPTAPRKRGRFPRLFGARDDAPDRAPEAEEPFDLDDAEMAPPEWTGRVVLCRDGELVVEIDLGGDDWQLPEAVEICLLDGRLVAAEVNLGLTTRAGPVAPGAQVRLALQVDDADLGTPEYVSLLIDGALYAVPLSS